MCGCRSLANACNASVTWMSFSRTNAERFPASPSAVMESISSFCSSEIIFILNSFLAETQFPHDAAIAGIDHGCRGQLGRFSRVVQLDLLARIDLYAQPAESLFSQNFNRLNRNRLAGENTALGFCVHADAELNDDPALDQTAQRP